MNSHAYLERLKADGLQNYLRENDVRYVITNRPAVREYVVDFHGLVVPADEAEVVADCGVREQYRAFKLWRVKDSYYATRESKPTCASAQPSARLKPAGAILVKRATTTQ